MLDILRDNFFQALLAIDRSQVNSIIANTTGCTSFDTIINELIVPVLEKTGKGWESGQLALSQVYMSSRLCEELVNDLIAQGQERGLIRKSHPKIALAVLEDRHVLGKKILYSVVRAAGYELLDFGHGLKVDELVEKTLKVQPDILLVSTLMFTSALRIKDLTSQLKQKGSEVKVMVGGAPFLQDKQLWKEVGAYAMGKTANDSLKLIHQVEKEVRQPCLA